MALCWWRGRGRDGERRAAAPAFHAANRLRFTWAYWALPAAIASITVVLLPQVPTQLLQVVVMLIAGALLAVAFYSLYATVEPGQPGFRRARFVLDAVLLRLGAAALSLCLPIPHAQPALRHTRRHDGHPARHRNVAHVDRTQRWC